MAARALAQAEDDLSTEKTRRGMATEDDARAERISRIEREAILTERKRILAILDAPVAVRRPRLARKFIESDVPARDTIEAMEGYERENAASRAKSAADLIVLAGPCRRGEVAARVTGAGPKAFVKTTAEEIIASRQKSKIHPHNNRGSLTQLELESAEFRAAKTNAATEVTRLQDHRKRLCSRRRSTRF